MKTTHQERNTTPRPTASPSTHPNKTRQSHQAHAEKYLPTSVKLINAVRYTRAADAGATNNNPDSMSGELVGSASSFTGGRCSTRRGCTRHVDTPPLVHDSLRQGNPTVGAGGAGAKHAGAHLDNGTVNPRGNDTHVSGMTSKNDTGVPLSVPIGVHAESISADAITHDDNLIIKGDNLVGLHWMLEEGGYRGKVKCIYIDPPYFFTRHKSKLAYNSNFRKEDWLSFLKERLTLARELLSDDGSFFAQISDQGVGELLVLLKEIFGDRNFVNMITTRTKSTSGFATVNKGLFNAAEYILVFAKTAKNGNPITSTRQPNGMTPTDTSSKTPTTTPACGASPPLPTTSPHNKATTPLTP